MKPLPSHSHKITYLQLFQLIFLVICLIIYISITDKSSAKQSYEDGGKALLPVLSRQYAPGVGNITGIVLDARTGLPIDSVYQAQICYQGGGCAFTDADGVYDLGGVPTGGQYLTVTADGYYPSSRWANVISNQPIQAHFALSPHITDLENVVLRIVLIWDATTAWPPLSIPNDLDAHMWLDAALDAHISTENRGDCTGNFPSACLEADEQFGFGPETIAIQSIENGSYHFGVLNYYQGYPGVPPMIQSSAQAQIYDENGLYQSFNVPSLGQGDFWYVFSLNSDGIQAVLTIHNCLTSFDGNVPHCP